MSNPYDTAKARNTSVLGPTLKFKGELTADEDLLIQGKIEGSIKHTSSLTVGESGHVKANISAEYIAVEGNVEGDLHGGKSVTVRETADIKGNISSPTVSLLEGATFNGNVDMSGEAKPASQDAPAQQEADDAAAATEQSREDAPRPAAASSRKSGKSRKKSADAA